MNKIMKLTAAYFKMMNADFEIVEEDAVILFKVSGLSNKGRINLLITFSDDESTVDIKTKEYAQFSDSQKAKIYEVCSKANELYRWAKFYVDEKMNTVVVSADAIVYLDSCGEELLQLAQNLCGALDEAFPDFMQVLWLE